MLNQLLRHPKDKITILYLAALASIKIYIIVGVSQIYPLLIMLLGFDTFLILSLRHNIAHYPIFRNAAINQNLRFLLCMLTGVSSKGLEIIHIQNHHQYINNKKDWGKTLTYQHSLEWMNFLQYLVKTPFVFLFKMRKHMASSKKKNQTDWEMILVLFIIAVFMIISWKQAIFYLIIPYLIGQLMLVSFNYFQHRNCDVGTIFETSRNFTGKWINWLTLNNGFHTAHHLHPHKHWSEYPEIHKKIKERIPSGLIQINFFAYFWKEILIKRYSYQLESTS